MKSNILLSLPVLIVILFSFASNSFAAITVTAVPDNTNPAPGDSIHVLVNIDLTDEEDLLGEYTIEVTWDPSVIAYENVSGGTTSEFSELLSNATNTESGSLFITYINGNGAGDLVNVAKIIFSPNNVPGAETDISLTVSSLSAAHTFKDLLSLHTVQSGHIIINSPPIIITEELPYAFENISYNATIEVNDPDESDTHTFELLESPDWLTIDENTGFLEGLPGTEDVGSNIVVLIRVEDSAGLADTLTTNINVSSDFIILKEPGADAIWSVGVEYEISWVYTGITDIKIELSVDGGASWEVIEERTTASTGSYKWKVLDRESINCIVKISDYADASVFHQSGIFTIRQLEIVIERIDPVLKAVQNDQIDFKVSVKSDTEISEVILHWDTTGERLFDNQLVMESSDGEIYSAILSEGTFTSDGIEYFIVARDAEDHMNRLPDKEKHYSICAVASGVVSKAPVPAGTAQTAYRMISVPLEFSFTSIAEQLSGRLPEGDKGPYWRLFRFPPGIDTPQEYPDIDEIIYPGAAFWMIAKNGFTLEAPPGTTVTTEETFKIELKPGWNDIANPWIFDISWNDISNPSNADLDGLFVYEGKWLAPNSQQIMKPWKGYTVRNMTNRPVIIFLKPESVSTLGKTVVDIYQYDWNLSISVQAGEAIDSENHLGVKIDASEEWDRYDHVEPPPIGEYVSIYFPHKDWEKYPYDYSMDFRPPDTEISWDFDVRTNISTETVSVKLKGIEQLPDGHFINIIDRDRERNVDIEENTFSFISGEELTERHYSIVVNDSKEPEQEPDISRPEKFVTAKCYPNPFNPQTTLHYELSHPGKVRIAVFNSIGQQVKIFEPGSKERGSHVIVIDASDLTSGLYIYRIDAGYAAVTGKMLYMK